MLNISTFNNLFFESKIYSNILIINKMKSVVLALCMVTMSTMLSAQTFIPLWEEGKVPNSTAVKVADLEQNQRQINVDMPGIYEYMPNPELFNGTAIVICPGGGYVRLSMYKEGYDIAKYFNTIGVAAYVLKYRLPQGANVEVSYKAPLQDAQRAIRKVRDLSKTWQRNSGVVGIIGFSAGGHLAATTGTLFRETWANVGDALDSLSCRPDFMALIYPVISFGEIAHAGSRQSLLGQNNMTEELIKKFSNELQVTLQTPPTILVHAADDRTVPVNNSIFFLQALKENQVKGALHIVTSGGHGFGITSRGETAGWPSWVAEFLRSNNLIRQ